ncbi:hypothetical protein [Secundilactobacillus similis]|uniref:Uncharacterized protein n=1 Tax=Secundilactobacillus similis DSM 23365 = JCM 2765 TaxID=1423804 RepID=A0A0R2F9S7_9LACO|nr:hypothetical protein [Secundilactobacillus similis]KRN21556.1 hypothetical protein FD14_GL000996 [Secundilactobacillus similis DSM 23365 = JCM 2765]
MSNETAPLGLEPITQYLSHHNNDYHNMVVGNLISIANVTGVTMEQLINEFDTQRAQLRKLADIDVTEFDGFHSMAYDAGSNSLIKVAFGDNQNNRQPNFFGMLNLAHEEYERAANADGEPNAVFEANHGDLSIKITADGVTVTGGDETLQNYVTAVVTTGYTA